jgi:hypothetical protein
MGKKEGSREIRRHIWACEGTSESLNRNLPGETHFLILVNQGEQQSAFAWSGIAAQLPAAPEECKSVARSRF